MLLHQIGASSASGRVTGSERSPCLRFDEARDNAKLGACRASGVLVRENAAGAWRVAQYNLLMAIPNEKALDVAALVRDESSS